MAQWFYPLRKKKVKNNHFNGKDSQFQGKLQFNAAEKLFLNGKAPPPFFLEFQKKKLNERSTSQNSLAMANVRSERNVTPQNKSGLFQFCMILTVFSKLRIKIKEFSQRGLKYNI